MVTNEDKMYKLKKETAEIYDSKCFICQKPFGKNFLYHHLKYFFNEKTYRQFKSTIDYNLYICPIVKNDPSRFILMCRSCHVTLERLKRRKKPNLIRLLLALWNTE